MNSLVTYNHFRVTYDTDSVHSLGKESSPCSVIADISNLHQNTFSMELERIKKLEDIVLSLQRESTLPKQKDLDSDILTRLGNLEASVIQEKAQKGELKKKLKFANNQNSRLLLRLKKEKARSNLLNYRMRGAKLPHTPIPEPLLQVDGRMTKSMNDIPLDSFGNQSRHAPDSSDSLSFTDEDSLPKLHSQIPHHRNKDESSREGRVEASGRSRHETGAQRIGARMSGEQALQLLPSYQQTIIQQQQEIRDLQLKIRSTEQTHYNLIQATQNGRQLVEYLNVITDREKHIEILKQKSRELQIGLMELENEKNDAVDLAKDLSLQLTRAKLAKDAALRTSRQLMEQFPTRPPREHTAESSAPSTPCQPENSLNSVPRSAPSSLSGDTKPNQSRYLPQPPAKQGRATTPKLMLNDPTEVHSSPTVPSPSYESATLPKSVQFFKKSVQNQKQSDMLPSKLVIKSKATSKTPDSASKLLTSVFRSKRDSTPINGTNNEISPLPQSLKMTSSIPVGRGTEVHKARSDSQPDPSTPGAKSLDLIRDNQSETPTSSTNCEYVASDGRSGDSMGKRALSMSTLASGLGFKGKQKEKIVKKKVKSAEEQVKVSGNNKVHKRFSSLNSLPNAFKRSPKLEERGKKRKEIPGIPDSSRKEKRKGRFSDDALEIEFKHISDITTPIQDSNTGRVSDKFRISLASLPISERSETSSPTEEFHSLVRSKKLGDINTLANLSTQSSPPWNS